MAFAKPKHLLGIGKNIVTKPGRTLGKAVIGASIVGALLPNKVKAGVLDGSAFSINKPGTPQSRGEVPTPAAPLPEAPIAATPLANTNNTNKRRKRAGGTILTGSRGLQSTTQGKTLLGG